MAPRWIVHPCFLNPTGQHPNPKISLCIACNNATDIELHDDVHTYAVGVADIAACEGSAHKVLHSFSNYSTASSIIRASLNHNL